MSPYRTPASPEERQDDDEPCPDADLLWVFALGWLGSVARVGLGMARHEAAGTEISLAFLVVLFVPLLFSNAAVWCGRRVRRRLRGRSR